MQLAEIKNLGAVATEHDFLPEYFVPPTSWAAVRSREHPIIIGRKGTGKTAVRYALRDAASTQPTVFLSELTFKDYPWALHNNVYDRDAPGSSRYMKTWTLLMLVELAKLRVRVDPSSSVYVSGTASVAELSDFLVQTWGTTQFDYKETFKRRQYRVARATLAPQLAGAALGSVEWQRVEAASLGGFLTLTNEWLKERLADALRDDHEYFLVLDELDIDFGRNNKTFADSLIGLLLAAEDIMVWANKLKLPIATVVLLRDDIYASLQFANKNKITMSLVEALQWNAGLAGPDSLKPIIDQRIRGRLELDGV
jgi:hypothetical protein